MQIKDHLGGFIVEDSFNTDNLSVVLVSYFSDHYERPLDDEPEDGGTWSKWVLEKTEKALALLARQIGDHT